MQSETIITELKDKWWKNGTVSCQTTEGNQGLSMDAVGGIFIVMAIGCGVSFLILLVEVVWTKYKNIKNGNKVQMNENVSKINTHTYSMSRVLQMFYYNYKYFAFYFHYCLPNKKLDDTKSLIRSRTSEKDIDSTMTKRTSIDLQNDTRKDRATLTPQKQRDELRCFGRVGSSCSTCDTHRVTVRLREHHAIWT